MLTAKVLIMVLMGVILGIFFGVMISERAYNKVKDELDCYKRTFGEME